MTERREIYEVLSCTNKSVTLEPDLHALQAELEELERRLIPLLVTVQRALGKQPTVLARPERYRR